MGLKLDISITVYYTKFSLLKILIDLEKYIFKWFITDVSHGMGKTID